MITLKLTMNPSTISYVATLFLDSPVPVSFSEREVHLAKMVDSIESVYSAYNRNGIKPPQKFCKKAERSIEYMETLFKLDLYYLDHQPDKFVH
jgi:hypothetical protein